MRRNRVPDLLERYKDNGVFTSYGSRKIIILSLVKKNRVVRVIEL
jgi:hypothetical protein